MASLFDTKWNSGCTHVGALSYTVSGTHTSRGIYIFLPQEPELLEQMLTSGGRTAAVGDLRLREAVALQVSG
jgi:hypothetical protein